MVLEKIIESLLDCRGSNPSLPHCRWILYQLSHQGKPKNSGVGSLSLLQRIILTQKSNWGPLICKRTLYQLRYQGRLSAEELMLSNWCWRKLLRVPWTAKRSNYSIVKEINPEY